MGSPLGPILTGFAMAKFESNLTNTSLFYARCVDDILCAFSSEDEAITFLNTLNSSSNALKFTMEIETDNKIVFLDVLIQRSINDGLQFS